MERQGDIQVLRATSSEHIEQVRGLIRSFVTWHRRRHAEDSKLIDTYFDRDAFEKELADLPGKYSLPEGRLFLALYNGNPAGCAAFRRIDAQTCEMKRMFVYDEFRGNGIGRALAEILIREARETGYTSMKLDTSFRQQEALTLYERMGFHKINAYYELPRELKDWLVFMELKL